MTTLAKGSEILKGVPAPTITGHWEGMWTAISPTPDSITTNTWHLSLAEVYNLPRLSFPEGNTIGSPAPELWGLDELRETLFQQLESGKVIDPYETSERKRVIGIKLETVFNRLLERILDETWERDNGRYWYKKLSPKSWRFNWDKAIGEESETPIYFAVNSKSLCEFERLKLFSPRYTQYNSNHGLNIKYLMSFLSKLWYMNKSLHNLIGISTDGVRVLNEFSSFCLTNGRIICAT